MTSENENSLIAASDRLRMLISENSEDQTEQERLKRARQRLKERYSSIPWYKEQGELDGDSFWEKLHNSAILSD